jgi:endonuclease/exonuclease/phosphatase family metal-dependent hydrolase
MRLRAVTAAVSLAFGGAACVEPADTFLAPEPVACSDADAPAGPLRVVTYNIHAGLVSSLDEVGDVLEDLDADVIALQEVDRDARRTGYRDQAGDLAARLDMDYAYGAAKARGDGDFGVAVLSRLPFGGAERIDLPSELSFEPRATVAADLCAAGGPIRVFAAHADLSPAAQQHQQRALAELAQPWVGQGVVVAGDLNATADEEGLQALFDTPLDDVGGDYADEPTCGDRRIDFLLADGALSERAVDAHVVVSDASDHHAVVIDLEL